MERRRFWWFKEVAEAAAEAGDKKQNENETSLDKAYNERVSLK